jgi:hypothetical protein
MEPQLTLTTPALLFPAISLLLLAYTNRFLAIANLIRGLHSKYQESHDRVLKVQIDNLRKRVNLTRNMQALGIISLFLCVLTMFLIYQGWNQAADLLFGIALLCLLASLGISVVEIQISVQALDIQMRDMEDHRISKKGKNKPDKLKADGSGKS